MKTLRISATESEFRIEAPEDDRILDSGPATLEFLIGAFDRVCEFWGRPVSIQIGEMPANENRTLELRRLILRAFVSIWKDVDVGEILAHPSVMRDKVESIQRQSERDRDRFAASFMRRRLGIESGDASEPLAKYYQNEFRLHRAKEIEDALIAGRTDEAKRDFQQIDADALVWAGWMLEAQHFPGSEALS